MTVAAVRSGFQEMVQRSFRCVRPTPLLMARTHVPPTHPPVVSILGRQRPSQTAPTAIPENKMTKVQKQSSSACGRAFRCTRSKKQHDMSVAASRSKQHIGRQERCSSDAPALQLVRLLAVRVVRLQLAQLVRCQLEQVWAPGWLQLGWVPHCVLPILLLQVELWVWRASKLTMMSRWERQMALQLVPV